MSLHANQPMTSPTKLVLDHPPATAVKAPETSPGSRSLYYQDKPLPAMPPEVRSTDANGSRVRSSWIAWSDDDDDDTNPDSSHLLPPSSYGRPRAPTPYASFVAPNNHDDPSSPSSQITHFVLDSICTQDSPVSPDSPSSLLSPVHPPARVPPRSSSITQPGNQISQNSFARPPKFAMPLPSPTDPYPFRPPHYHLTSLPALSSAGSSSASTRSSAYTSSGSALASGDYGHIQVASGDDESAIGVGITSDSVVQMLANDPNASSSATRRSLTDQTRWSESYSSSVRSRSSSLGNSNSNSGHEGPSLQQKPSYDMTWQTVDERDEVGLSEEETDDDHGIALADENHLEGIEEERTSAAVVADEGRGLIVQADSVPIVQLQVQSGTTHLLIGSSTTPNAVPAFLTNTLPQISVTLLALDISANFLSALPPVLAICENLEELNVASNPLRVLPVFLADLVNLRVIIADATGISTLPDALVDLEKLHTISVRRNKMHALPSWLCLLPALQTLCVDGNPFEGPWKALVEPLLAKTPMTPSYPPSTPIFPLPSASIVSSSADTETDTTDIDESSERDPESPDLSLSPEEEDHTITPERAPFLGRTVTSPMPFISRAPVTQPQGLARTRTTPSRAYFDQSRANNFAGNVKPTRESPSNSQNEDSGYFGDRELRKMKSAGDLRREQSGNTQPKRSEPPTPAKPQLSRYPTSLSSSNLLTMEFANPEPLAANKRFASLGPTSIPPAPSHITMNGNRPQLTKSVSDNISEPKVAPSLPITNRTSIITSSATPLPPLPLVDQGKKNNVDAKNHSRQRSTREAKEKSSRWGFLKKMSMGKMRIETSPPASAPPPRSLSRPHTSAGLGSPPKASVPAAFDRFSKSPQIDVRFSAGTFDDFKVLSPATAQEQQQQLHKQASRDLTPEVVAPPRSSSLLAPPPPVPRANKRRSFLPVEAPGGLTVDIPQDISLFTSGATVINDADGSDLRAATPSPIADQQQYMRREEERARESYMRALRSVMAYLKDMNDLGHSQQAGPLSMYGSAAEDISAARSRRPTVVEGTTGPREVSMVLSMLESNSQLRSSESITGLRSGTASQTMSVATTDSNSSYEERKFKDDKGKRAMVVKEILLTERTYVKNLQELVDIYIKPASVPVNILSGVGSGKETVVPASERKIVFGGVDALFSFHKESFLPALEVAAAPLIKATKEVQEADADGQLSLSVAKAVGNMFLKHAAFMKMYSTYINNFDNSVQRVKYWSSEKNTLGTTTPSSTLSPSSSTAQLVGLGISISAISSPGVLADMSSTTGVPNLSTGQRKRIKSYLKRCRMNPRHTQLNLEGYLLLPVQRIPRYRLLLEQLLQSTPPTYDYMEDSLERALVEISSLANNMNEGKRESESRRKLVQWQARIRGKFPSPLVQPHRRLIMDGKLLLTRVVRKTVVTFESINALGDASTVQVDCLAPELTPRPLIGILCNDLLVLCRDPSEGNDPNSYVDLWAVLRMQTLPQPASIVHGNALRLVDNKAVLYFDAPSPSDALNWYRAINLHIPASKS